MPNSVRFGSYEADLDSGQLRKDGIRLKLRDQSFLALVSLLERPGRVVTREELRHRLWHDAVFVDFDNNLNAIIARLREALGDSSDHPHFIETLPKHGYRFIANISVVDCEPRPPAGLAVPAVLPAKRAAHPRSWRVRAAWGIAALLVILGALEIGGLRKRLFGHAAAPRITSLAVLPLTNLSRNPEQEYFADGMTDSLITELARINALKVISRTSVMQYKTTIKTAPQIAAELNVDGLVEGSVQREGDQVRINVQLIYGPSDKHLWAESYQRQLPGILTLQSEIARDIAQEVRAKLTSEEHARLAHVRNVDPQAYEAYLRGRHLLRSRTGDSLQEALENFETAVRIDPGYALAYTGLANTYSILGDQKFLAPDESFPKARVAAQKALELDENLAEAHAAMALVLHAYAWDWRGGEREIDRAIQLNPSYAAAHHWRALFLSQMGRHAEAIAEMKEARSLDPLSPRINANLGGVVLYEARQYQPAIQELRKALELFPNDAAANGFLARALFAVGRHREAIEQSRHALTLVPGAPPSTELARLLARAGQQREARQIIAQAIKAREHGQYVSAPGLAAAYAALGQKDQAFAWLQKGYAEHDTDMEWLRVAQAFDPLRSDPRFTAFLRKMNLQP